MPLKRMCDDLQIDRKRASSLCKGITEIIKLVWGHYSDDGMESTNSQRPALTNTFQLFINVQTEDKSIEQSNANPFSIKVRCNQQVALDTLIKSYHAPELQSFAFSMQEVLGGSPLTFYRTDANNPDEITATSIVFTSRKDLESYSQVIDRKNWNAHDALLVHLKASMDFTCMMKEIKNLLDYLWALKLMNPDINLSFDMDGGNTLHLNLCDDNAVNCGSLSCYAQPQLWLLRNSVGFVCGTPVFKYSEFRSRASCPSLIQQTFAKSLSCVMCLIPVYKEESSVGGSEKDSRKTNDFIYGQVNAPKIQVYHKNGLPIGVLSILKDINLHADSLATWDTFGMQISKETKKNRFFPYKAEWSARLIPNRTLPPEIDACTKFILSFNFVLNQQFSHDQPLSCHYSVDQFKDCAESCLKDVFHQNQHKPASQPQIQTADSDLLKYWIPDIASSLGKIFTRSTNANFRARFGSLIPTNPGKKIHSEIESNLWKIMRPLCNGMTDEEQEMPVGIHVPSSVCSNRHKSALLSSFMQNEQSILDHHLENEITLSENKIPPKPLFDTSNYHPANDNSSRNGTDDKFMLERVGNTSHGELQNCCHALNTKYPLSECCLSGDSLEMINPEKISMICKESVVVKNSPTEEQNKRVFVKKRSFEESEASSTGCDDYEAEFEDWMNLEDDLDQMKKLRLSDYDDLVYGRKNIETQFLKHGKTFNETNLCDMTEDGQNLNSRQQSRDKEEMRETKNLKKSIQRVNLEDNFIDAQKVRAVEKNTKIDVLDHAVSKKMTITLNQVNKEKNSSLVHDVKKYNDKQEKHLLKKDQLDGFISCWPINRVKQSATSRDKEMDGKLLAKIGKVRLDENIFHYVGKDIEDQRMEIQCEEKDCQEVVEIQDVENKQTCVCNGCHVSERTTPSYAPFAASICRADQKPNEEAKDKKEKEGDEKEKENEGEEEGEESDGEEEEEENEDEEEEEEINEDEEKENEGEAEEEESDGEEEEEENEEEEDVENEKENKDEQEEEENEEDEDWFDSKKLTDWYESLRS